MDWTNFSAMPGSSIPGATKELRTQASPQRLAEQEDCLQAALLLGKCGSGAAVSSTELRGIVAGLREQAAKVRTGAERAQARHLASGERLLELVSQVDRERCLSSRESAEAADEAAEVAALEQRLGVLQLEEGELRREAQLEALRTKLDLEALAARAAEAERHQAETALRAASAASALPGLQAAMIAEERRLQELQQRHVKLSEQVSSATPSDELQHYEWCRMLVEDRPEHLALSVVEAESASWEKRLHDALAPLAFRGPPKSEGLVRLEAELDNIGAVERAKRASCSECLRKLRAQEDDGPWSNVVSELQEAYQVIVKLRSSSDALAGEIASCRWRRTGSDSAAASLLDSSPAPRRMVVTQPHMPRGPRFHAPALVRPKAKAQPSEQPRSKIAMPSAVITNANDWEAGLQDAPTRSEPPKGLSFLLNDSSERFRPGNQLSNDFGPSFWTEENLGTAAAEFEKPLPKTTSQLPSGPTKEELARQAAAAFRQPLSAALGASPQPPYRASSFSGSDQPRFKQRAEWVTFEASPPAQNRVVQGHSGFAAP